jgi:hypothetical protein
VSAYGGSDLNFWGSLDHHSLRLGNRDESRIADLTATGLEALGAEV